MYAFRVDFENNHAVAASQLHVNRSNSMQIVQADGKNDIKWITIYADDERESLKIAEKVVKDYMDLA
jgi:hypothetical protein